MAEQVNTPRSLVFLSVEQASQPLFLVFLPRSKRPCPVHVTSMLESPGESRGTVTVTRTAQPTTSTLFTGFSAESSTSVQDTACVDRPSASLVVNEGHGAMSLGEFGGKDTLQRLPAHRAKSQPDVGTQCAPVGYLGVELMRRDTCISRKKHNRETRRRQSKALKSAQREAKRKLVAQPGISHEAAEAFLSNLAARTYEKFPGIIHVSHQLALLLGHENVFFCTQCGAVNAGGLKSVRRLWRIPPEQDVNLSVVWCQTNMLWQMRSVHFKRAVF